MNKILIVEDDFNIRNMTNDLLIANQYIPILASGGKEAIDLHTKSIDLILLDLMLPQIHGKDLIGISELRDLFKKLNLERNITILISSHILNELYQVSNKFCIIEKGKVIKEITKEKLDEECSKCIVIKIKEASKVAVILEEQLKTKNYKIIDDTEIRLYDYLEDSSKVNKTLIKNDIDIISLYETGITLEDYFKTIIKEGK